MSELVLGNAQVVLPDRVIAGHVVVSDGLIVEIGQGPVNTPAVDLDGAYLLPGLVELHTDHLEGHYHPRPGVSWPPLSAVLAHDAQIAAAGITTVFDALRAGAFESEPASMRDGTRTLADAIGKASESNILRAEHFIHLRCELPCPDTVEVAEEILAGGLVRLLSVMDHTPGERQFVNIDKFREYYLGKKIISAERLEIFIAERREMNHLYSARNRAAIAGLAALHQLRLASHDDATAAHVAEAIADGAAIAEFPTTAESAGTAHESGLAVLMGAPNLVRGGSHSGNIGTSAVAASGHLDVLSSDYVPSSLLHAAFALPGYVEHITLPEAVNMVSRNPAAAAGISDRGQVASGLRADFAVVRLVGKTPVIRSVWREGERVL
ncbi:alpha-D-ribose 1-methylphosphonate 5-triphosphate diphosphatase [soil metagenome]